MLISFDKNLLFSLCIFAQVSLFATSICEAKDVDSKPITQHKITIGKLQKEIEKHEDKIDLSSKEEGDLLAEMERLDQQSVKQQKIIKKINLQIEQQTRLIQSQEAEVADVLAIKEEMQKHLTKRLKSFYLMGKTGFLNVTFSSKTLPDLMVFNDNFRQLLIYDQEVFQSYRDALSDFYRVRQAYELEKTVLLSLLDRTKEEAETLQTIHEEKDQLLHRVKTQKGLYTLALKEMQKAEGNFNAALTKLKKKQENKAKGFLLNKGKLPIPAAGELLTRFKGKVNEEEGPSLTHGITIKTGAATKVHAVFEGKVIFSGYMRGYGKMLIIDHGLEYYTVIARFDELISKEGDQVKQGQLVGMTGDIATLFGKGLYFEVRHESKPLDPLSWLKPGAYMPQKTTATPDILTTPDI